MEDDSVPKLRPYDLIHWGESPEQKALRLSYNWRMTDHGWLRMDKKKIQAPSTPKEIAAGDCFGQCFNEDGNCWMQCFEFDSDGSIHSRDTSFHTVRSAAGNVEVDLDKVCITTLFYLNHFFFSITDASQALSLVANASKTAGAIFILAGSSSGWLRLSGFFITDRFFLTCGNFAMTATIEEVIKKSGSKMASVCTDRKPYGIAF